MNAEKLAAVHARAKSVLDGFTTVRAQQARDVLSCTEYIAELEHARDVLMRRLMEATAPQRQAKQGESFSDAFGDIFGDIFGNKKS